MTTPNDVLRLINQFAQQAAYYHSSRYNETQARREFIDPLFEQLGWDVSNRNGQPEDAREVIHEDRVRVRATDTLPALPLLDLLNAGTAEPVAEPPPIIRDGGRKAPDYSFRVGRTRKFFLEAKKPGVNIRDSAETAFQLRRYGWSASLPLSILTDFAEWAIYDCRVEPHQKDKADRARLDYFTYDQLPDKWEWLLTTFGREAVRNGSFDQYAEAKKSAKGNVPVDKAFLKTIESWRELLARDLAWRNQHLSTRELNAAVQMTLDRIIFLRICEDRGIEPYGQLLALTNGLHLYPQLGRVFQQADARYNSGLFHFKAERGRTGVPDDWTLNLSVGDDELRTVIKRLYFPDSPYVFDQIPADILGQVYEQFLGKVIRLESGHRAVVEDKPEVKKAGGVYYTPTYIVDYIVEHTVGKLLEGKTPQQVRGTGKNAAPLRILDPACGSGSFLIGAYQYVLDWYRAWYTANDPAKHKDAVYQSESGAWWLTLAERKRILLDHIFGVDIDTQAVEVTKLSLLLKVLEGETEETLGSYRRLVQQRALPSLENNIKCGNSLIGSDFYAQQALPDMDEQLRVNVFDWDGSDGFPTIMHAGGFDAVIGNPPWVFTRDVAFGNLAKHYFARRYIGAQGKVNLYALFIFRGLKLLREGGLYSMIIPNTFLRATTYSALREHILRNGGLEQIADTGSKVFQGVTASTIILLTRGGAQVQTVKITKLDQSSDEVQINTLAKSRLLGNPGVVVDIYADEAARQLVDRVRRNCSSLSFYEEHLISGIQTWKQHKSKFIANKPINNEYKPLLEGKDIGRYQTSFDSKFIWYNDTVLNVMQDEKIFLLPEKIIIQRISGGRTPIKATIDRNRYYCFNSVNTLVCKDISNQYILGILNSKFMNWFYSLTFSNLSDLTVNIANRNLRQLPIRTIDFANPADRHRHDDMVRLVERMLELHTRKAAAFGQERTVIERQIAATDREIDRLVYTLYDLTDEEIAIVEAATQ